MKKNNVGEKLVYAIENGQIMKDYLPNYGETFYEGYEELYLHKFKTYLGSVSRVIVNWNLGKNNGNGYD